MIYRKLEKEEFDRIKPIFAVEEWFLPDRNLSAVFIAENDAGKICGLLTMEFKLHAEPLWIHPDEIGKVTFRGLATCVANEVVRIKDHLPEGAAVYMMTSEENVEKLAGGIGFAPMEEKCWKLDI